MDKAANPLEQLKDIHLPEAISWWPLAPGWYILILLLVLLLSYVLYRMYSYYKKTLAKKNALKLLRVYQKNYEQDRNAPLASASVSELLRRVALAYYPREKVASLHDEAWIHFLTQSSNGIDFKALRDTLLEAPFKPSHDMDISPLFKAAEAWIKQRRNPCSN